MVFIKTVKSATSQEVEKRLLREAARWQSGVEDAIRKAGYEPWDASGNESGDPLDWTVDQVEHALDDARAAGNLDEGRNWQQCLDRERELRRVAEERLAKAREALAAVWVDYVNKRSDLTPGTLGLVVNASALGDPVDLPQESEPSTPDPEGDTVATQPGCYRCDECGYVSENPTCMCWTRR